MSLLKRLEKEKSRRVETEAVAGPSAPKPSHHPGREASHPKAPRPSREVQVPKVELDLFSEWKIKLHQKLVQRMFEDGEDEDLETAIRRVLDAANAPLPRHERDRMVAELRAEAEGFGPIDVLLRDDSISEVMVNGPSQVYVERNGRLELSAVKFLNDAHVLRVIEKIVAPLGRRIDESSPMVDARLPDGSRVNAIIPPLAVTGPCITIRKFAKDPYQVHDLILFQTLTEPIAEFLEACVTARLNVVVSGGTGSGKSTTLNVLSSFIPETERVVTIEDAAELQLRQEHVVTLETRPANIEGKGAVTMRDLVKNSLRMRPDRIVVGEVRGGEALDMLQAMNTGHDGSLTTAHANTPRDCLRRLEVMVLMAGMDLPLRAIREQVASAVDLIVQQARLRDGSRKIVAVSEVLGMEGENVVLQDIFEFRETGRDEQGRIVGEHRPTGIVPTFLERLQDQGFQVDYSWFQPGASGWR
ncbi:CpaF family protein [Alicyclobacillus tolerans]|uniref:CpaF family protein n=1 Tax=Alicyclobacillus tolerans TaxID=90970 RepID=UPI001F40F902|nr:CpaF family protein [Alicyclobacillus tolerans]MCF8563836.1 CpaF family protein [Alicyclobacillus tolerans]